jgi:hypothetical protein
VVQTTVVEHVLLSNRKPCRAGELADEKQKNIGAEQSADDRRQLAVGDLHHTER